MRNYLIFIAVAGFWLCVDQATKFYIDASMPLFTSIPVIDNIFSITYVRNPGAAFGMFAESGFRVPFLTGVSLVAMVAILIALRKLTEKDKVALVALACIFAGAGGNLIDRLRLGEVIDFLDVYWKNHHWPTFNVADSVICMGMLMYMYLTFKEERQRKLLSQT